MFQMWTSVWRRLGSVRMSGSASTVWAPTPVPVLWDTSRSTAPAVEVTHPHTHASGPVLRASVHRAALMNTHLLLGFCVCVFPDVDECADEAELCSPNGDCLNTQGSYLCVCDSGFTANIDTPSCDGRMQHAHTHMHMHWVLLKSKWSSSCYSHSLWSVELNKLHGLCSTFDWCYSTFFIFSSNSMKRTKLTHSWSDITLHQVLFKQEETVHIWINQSWFIHMVMGMTDSYSGGC